MPGNSPAAHYKCLHDCGAGDGDRTRDIQLGKPWSTLRSTTNQTHTAGHLGPSVALSALIEHDSEHNFSQSTPQPHPLHEQDGIREPQAWDQLCLQLLAQGYRQITYIELTCPVDGDFRGTVDPEYDSREHPCPRCSAPSAYAKLGTGFTRRTLDWEQVARPTPATAKTPERVIASKRKPTRGVSVGR
jgi:hypothetical protein